MLEMKSFQLLLLLSCLISLQSSLEIVDDTNANATETKAQNQTTEVNDNDEHLSVTEYGKDMVQRRNPSSRDNGLNELWEKVPVAGPKNDMGAGAASPTTARGIK